MGRRGVLAVVVAGVLTAGCAEAVDGRAVPAPSVRPTVAQLETDPCAALYPDQVRAVGLTRSAGAPDQDGTQCTWTAPGLKVELRAVSGQTLAALRSSGVPYIDTTLAGRPALAYRVVGLCITLMEAGPGTVLVSVNATAPDAAPCAVAIRVIEQAVENITNPLPTPDAAVDLATLATTPCSAGTRIPVASIVGPGSAPVPKTLETGDLSCRWVGDDGGLTFVAVAGAGPSAPPGSQPTQIGGRAGSEVRRPRSCSVAVLVDGRSLQVTVLTTATAPRPSCDSAHLAMRSLLAG